MFAVVGGCAGLLILAFSMLSFVIAEEDLWIETSYPFNEVTAVFLLNNFRYHHTSHSDEPLSYQDDRWSNYVIIIVQLQLIHTCTLYLRISYTFLVPVISWSILLDPPFVIYVIYFL